MINKKNGLEMVDGKTGSFRGGGMCFDDFENRNTDFDKLSDEKVNNEFFVLYDRLIKGLAGRPIPKQKLDVIFPNEKGAAKWQHDFDYQLELAYEYVAYQSLNESLDKMASFVQDTVDMVSKWASAGESIFGNTIDGYDEIMSATILQTENYITNEIKLDYFSYEKYDLKNDMAEISENDFKDLVSLIDYDNHQVQTLVEIIKAFREIVNQNPIQKVY